VDTTTWHLAFIVAAAATAGFALVMQRRLRLNYPGDDSKQMRSMLGFLRALQCWRWRFSSSRQQTCCA